MSAKDFNRKDVAKWLNTLGYDFEVDSKDDLWMKEFITDHKLSDIFDICLAWGEKVANESKNCNLQDVNTSALLVGSKVRTPLGLIGLITKITQNGVAWVSIKNRWGGHHKPVTKKTHKFDISALEHWC